jgi:hypothetical protein
METRQARIAAVLTLFGMMGLRACGAPKWLIWCAVSGTESKDAERRTWNRRTQQRLAPYVVGLLSSVVQGVLLAVEVVWC